LQLGELPINYYIGLKANNVNVIPFSHNIIQHLSNCYPGNECLVLFIDLSKPAINSSVRNQNNFDSKGCEIFCLLTFGK